MRISAQRFLIDAPWMAGTRGFPRRVVMRGSLFLRLFAHLLPLAD
jgi:hypothetical protein